MATKKNVQKGIKPQTEYSVYSKKAVWIEALCVFLIWLLFIAGLGLVFYLRGPANVFGMATNSVILGILFLSLVPFVANWDYYAAIWKAWRTGKEIMYKEPDANAPYSILGNREVWIKN